MIYKYFLPFLRLPYLLNQINLLNQIKFNSLKIFVSLSVVSNSL